MKFDYIQHRLYALGQIERTREQEFERDVLVGMQNVLDCIYAFEIGNRKPTKTYDLGELVFHLEYALNLTKNAIKVFKALQEESECPQCGHKLTVIDETRKECPECECIVQRDISDLFVDSK